MLQWLFFYKKDKQGNVTGIHSSCFKLVVLLENKKIKKTNNDATKGLIVRELLFLNHTSLGRYRSTLTEIREIQRRNRHPQVF